MLHLIAFPSGLANSQEIVSDVRMEPFPSLLTAASLYLEQYLAPKNNAVHV